MKKRFYILSAIFAVLVIIEIVYAFSLLESETTRVVQNELGRWTILVNETDITGSVVDFQIDNIHYDSATNVKSGKIAPGLGGYFDISIDPTNTEVAVRYDITYDCSLIEATETSISISSVTELSGKSLVRTGEYTYSGILSLSEINSDTVDTIRTNIMWEDVEQNGEKDYEVGKEEDAKIEIPVTVKLTQYTGEQLSEYTGE